MKIVGLITEYNPFHNGHHYHIEEAKRSHRRRYRHCRHERRLCTERYARHHAQTPTRRNGFKMRRRCGLRAARLLCHRKRGIIRHGRRILSGQPGNRRLHLFRQRMQ